MNEWAIKIENLSIAYKSREPVLQEISINVEKGQFVVLLGPSGCGKTTLLKFLAGLLNSPDIIISGEAFVNGFAVTSGKQLDGNQIGFVFENPSLLPWRTVMDNSLIGCEVKEKKKANSAQKVIDLLNEVGLTPYSTYYPGQLSLGMQQRVGLVRSLAYDPALIFMDTPFSGIDSQRKLQLLDFVSTTLYKNRTILYVTHDVGEATMLADDVVVLSDKPTKIKKVIPIDLGRPRDVYMLRKSREFALLEQAVWSEVLSDSQDE